MTLSTLWPLSLLPLIAILVIFYLLKQPAKEKLLSSLAFWQSAYKQQHSQKPWEKFRHNLLMYLQILTILLLILSLCAPVLKNAATPAEHILLIFDTSGSMQTLYSKDGTTRLEQAKKEAEKLISSASHTEITIISCSDQAQILLNNSNDNKKIRSVINKIEPDDCTGSLNSAVSFCDSICSQWDKARCVFFTDSSLDTKNLLSQIYDLSTNPNGFNDSSFLTSNLAINSCYCYEDSNGLSIEANIQNTGNTTISSDINFYWNDTIIAVEPCKISAGESKFIGTKISNDIINSCNQIKIEIQEQDALSKDNIFYAIYNQQEENRILLASKQNSFLENALKTVWQTSENIYKITSIKDYDPEETYALSIFDGIYPEQLPKSGSVILFPDSKHMKSSGKKIQNLVSLSFDGILKNNYVNLCTSSVSDYLQEMTFPVAKLLSMQAPAEAENIFQLDNGNSGGYITRNNGSFLTVFGFNLHDTDFPLQTEFPILMYNLCQKSLTHTDFSLNNTTLFVEAGDAITFFPSDIGKRVSIRNEEKKEVKSLTPSSSLSSSTVLYKSGFYDFYTKSKKHHAYIAVNFSANTESNILEVPEFTSKDQNQSTIKKTSSPYELPLQKLFLILALLFFIAEFIVWSYQQLNKKQRPFFLAMRSFFVFLLCLSLLDISITIGKGSETTIFLVDVSDSMKKDLSTIESQLNYAIKKLPANSKAGIVAFGANSCIEHFISSRLHFNQLETTPITSATNLENALQTASSMFSASDSKRIILFTDGLENEGMAKNMSSTILENGISLKVMKFHKNTYDEVLISNVHVNEHLTVGERFQVEVTVLSNVNTSATLSLYSGDTLRAEKEVSLTSGSNRFLFYDTLTKSGLNSYRAIIECNQDNESINNEYLTFTHAEEKSKILLIEGKPEEAKEFEKILTAAQMNYEKIPPIAAPKKTLSLQKYSVVICENVHADDLPDKFKAILPSYVENGGALIAIGGDNSFALGNYQGSVFDDVLPVTSTLVGENKVPETAMALVIDHSGSMQDGNAHVSRLSLAKEAAISALTSLRKIDSIGVLEFDDSYHWVVPFTKAENIEEIQREISSIQINGGTSIYPALSEAVKTLSNEKAKLKHIILLTDGEDGFRDYQDLYDTMKEQKITLSTVAVSDGADTTLLKSMAEAGQGRYYYADISTDIPRIFAQEVYLSSDSYLINREFMPLVLGAPLVLRPLTENGLQPLYGYIRTTLQPTAYSLLISDTRDPILAMKNYGLGTSIAFTSDVTNEWTKDYAGLNSYASFWKTLIENSMIETDTSNAKLTIDTENMTAHIGYETLSASDSLEVTAVCTDEEGNSFSVPLSAASPYYFEATIDLEHTGIYSVTVTENALSNSSNTNTNSITTRAFASQYSKEYQIYDDDSTIDDLISLTNAEEITDPKEFYTGTLKVNASSHSLTTFFLLLVLFLFMIDIAARRFGFLSFYQKKNHGFIKLMKKGNFFKTISLKLSSDSNHPNTISTLSHTKQGEELIKAKPEKKKLKKEKTKPELLDTSQLLTSRRVKK